MTDDVQIHLTPQTRAKLDKLAQSGRVSPIAGDVAPPQMREKSRFANDSVDAALR